MKATQPRLLGYCLSPKANFPHRPHSHLPPRKRSMSYREGEPIVTNDPAEDPLQWPHRFPTSDPS